MSYSKYCVCNITCFVRTRVSYANCWIQSTVGLYDFSSNFDNQTNNLYVIHHDDIKSENQFLGIYYHLLTRFPVVLEPWNCVYRLLEFSYRNVEIFYLFSSSYRFRDMAFGKYKFGLRTTKFAQWYDIHHGDAKSEIRFSLPIIISEIARITEYLWGYSFGYCYPVLIFMNVICHADAKSEVRSSLSLTVFEISYT